MKSKYITSLAVLILLVSTACNDEFLDRFPETSIGKENFFNSEEDLSLYINNLYNFPGSGLYMDDGYATTDNAANTGNTELKTMMTTDPSSGTINGGWDWEYLRTVNFFLENFQKAEISREGLDHFEGLARFFRARFYLDKVKRYSDVPWYDQVLNTDDEEALYKGRDTRAMVVDKIFEDFQFAVDHIREVQAVGAVNKWVAMSFMARYALYEGTFRKYHPELNLQNTADTYLQMARDMAKQIMDAGLYSIHNTGNPDADYYNLFVSTDLSSNPEVILNNIAVAGFEKQR